MNWYKLLKIAARHGDYWILPDGSTVTVNDLHVTDGWEHLQKLEPNIDPEEKPKFSTQYKIFGDRGWVRMAGFNWIQLFKDPPYPHQQAKTISDLSQMRDSDTANFDMPLGRFKQTANNTRAIINFLTTSNAPKVVSPQTTPVPAIQNQNQPVEEFDLNELV